MTWPTASGRTKDWGTEILTDAELEGQFDLLHAYINAFLNGTNGHDHSGADGYGKKIVLTTSVQGVLPIANGGTGLSAYTIGDIPYASAADTIGLLGYATKGQALITNGVGLPPSYAGMTTGGDIEYHDGTTRNRLAKPSAGKILQHDGTIPTWVSVIGDPVTKSEDTVYQADTDGFVCGYVSLEQNDQFVIYTDSSNPPTTVVMQMSTNANIGSLRIPFCLPVKRGNYWKFSVAAGSTTPSVLQFIPIGA